MKPVYPSKATALFTVLIMILAGLLVWFEGGNTPATWITEAVLFLSALLVVLSSLGLFPLYRLG